jgi:hypothetical protein
MFNLFGGILMDDFMTPEMLTTFAGLTIAVGIIVQFTKPIIKRRFSDLGVRIYVFIISFILTMLFANSGFTAQGIVLTLINSILVCMSAMGGYEIMSDPMAQKKK